jgi:hypothetical protein
MPGISANRSHSLKIGIPIRNRGMDTDAYSNEYGDLYWVVAVRRLLDYAGRSIAQIQFALLFYLINSIDKAVASQVLSGTAR